MPRVIQLAASLPASPDRLFDMYLDPAEHSAFTGSSVTISADAGAPFRAFDDALTGTILQVVPKRLIVQAWRSFIGAPRISTRPWSFRSGPRRTVGASSSCTSMWSMTTSPASVKAGRSSTGPHGVRILRANEIMLPRGDKFANESIVIPAVEARVFHSGELPEAKKWVREELAQ